MSERPPNRSRVSPTDNAVRLLRELDAQRVEGPVVAEPMERLVARLMDLGLLVAVFVAVGTVSGTISYIFDGPDVLAQEDGSLVADAAAVAAMILFALVLLLNEAVAGARGQTWGKRLYSLHLLDTRTKAPPGAIRGLLRTGIWLAPLIASASAWAAAFPDSPALLWFITCFLVLVPPLVIFVRPDHRGLHDLLTGTEVRRDR